MFQMEATRNRESRSSIAGILILAVFVIFNTQIWALTVIGIILCAGLLAIIFRNNIKNFFSKVVNGKKRSAAEEDNIYEDVSLAENAEAFIDTTLFSTYGENAEWKWASCPPSIDRGGTGRIITQGTGGHTCFDVCVSPTGFMRLYVAMVQEVNPSTPTITSSSESDPAPHPVTKATLPSTPGISLDTVEGVEKWYRIVLKNALTETINNLNVLGFLSLTIPPNGDVYTDDPSVPVLQVGNLPAQPFWDGVVELLEEEGLFAEEREEGIFISWPQDEL